MRDIDFTDEQIEDVYKCAKALMTIADIADYFMVDIADFRAAIFDKNSSVSKHYRKGKAETLFEIQTSEVSLAINGSPQGVLRANEYLQNMADDEMI